MRHAALKMICFAALLPMAADAQLVSYVDSSNRDRLKGRFDLALSSAAAGLDADLMIAARDGATRFTPRITVSWAPGPRLDIRSVIQSGDLNRQVSSTTARTQIVLRPAVPFVERIETSLRHGSANGRGSLEVGFANIDTELDLFGGQALSFHADMQHERGEGQSVTTTSLTSRFGLGRAVSVQSRLKLDDSAGTGIERSTLETRLVYRTPFAFLKSVEGKLRRRPDGNRQSLALSLSDIGRELGNGASYTVSGKALIREIALANGPQSRRIGFEAKIHGLFPSPIGGRNSLGFDVERGLGGESLRTASLSYNHEWTPTELARIDLQFETKRREDAIEPAMDVSWSARF